MRVCTHVKAWAIKALQKCVRVCTYKACGRVRVRRRATSSHEVLIHLQYAKPKYRCSISAAMLLGEAGRGLLKRLSPLADSSTRPRKCIR